VIGAAVMVARIATGEVEDVKTEKDPHAVALLQSLGGRNALGLIVSTLKSGSN